MRLFGVVDSTINRLDRAEWLTPPFDLAFAEPTPDTGDEQEDDMTGMMIDKRQKAIGSQFLSDLSSSTALTPPDGYQLQEIEFIVIDVQSQDARCWFDGTVPTGSSGHLLKANRLYPLSVDLRNFRIIEATSGAKAAVTFFTSQAQAEQG